MRDTYRVWTVLSTLGTVRPLAPGFVAVCAFVLALEVGVVAGLEDSASGLEPWTRVWRWCAANLVAATVITLSVVAAEKVTPERWYLDPAKGFALALSYGTYFTAGLLGGLARFVMTVAIQVPPADATVTHHVARVAAVTIGMVLLGFVANHYRLFLDRIRSQQQALQDRIDELWRENEERRKAEEEAAAKEARLAATLRTMAEGVVLTDRRGQVMLANQAAERLVGRTQEEALGRSLAQMLLGFLGPKAHGFLADWPDGVPYEVESETTPHRQLQLLSTSIAAGPEAGGRVLLIRDVTEEKAARLQSEQERRLASLGQLAAGIAHDFNNLLTGITGASEALQMRRDLPEPARALARRISEGGLRAAHLVRQVLDFSRQAPTPTGSLDVSAVVVSAQEMLRHAIPESVHMQLDIDPGSYVIRGNASQLERLLMNLAVNASESMPEGGELRIQVRCLTLEPQFSPPVLDMSPGNWVAIAVSDSGLGIAPENLDKIFDPFFTTKAQRSGTGLGLAQVYGIVHQHGGHLVVDSRLGVGSTFTIYLPAIPEAAVLPPQPPAEDIPRGRGETILLVEDDTLLLDVLGVLLESLGYRVLRAANGQDALTVYGEHHDEVDLVVTDVTMPVMGGVELFRVLLQLDPDVKLLALTGHAFDRDTQQYLASGMVAWLEKPPGLPALAQALRRALRDEVPSPTGGNKRNGESL